MNQNIKGDQVYFQIIKSLLGTRIHPIWLAFGWVLFISLLGYLTGYSGILPAAQQSELPFGQMVLYDAFPFYAALITIVLVYRFRQKIKTSAFQLQWQQLVDLHALQKMRQNKSTSSMVDCGVLISIVFIFLLFMMLQPLDQMLIDEFGLSSWLIIWILLMLIMMVFHYGIALIVLRLLAAKDISHQLQRLKK